MVAFACHPHQGSESGVGWQWVRAIADRYEVELYTRCDGTQDLEEAVKRENLPINVIRISTPFDGSDKDGYLRYPRYASWLIKARRQLKLRQAIATLEIIHHLTFASDWMPTCIFNLGARSVWGPVGGSTYTPPELRRHLSLSARVKEFVRWIVGTTFRRTITLSTIRQADVCVALNADTANELRRLGAKKVIIMPNAIIELPPTQRAIHSQAKPANRYVATYVGRLVEWKGLQLAISAMASAALSNWDLHIYGDGNARTKFEALTNTLGLQDRIVFFGNKPREEVISAVSEADALVFPSFHDSGPWAVAEAASVGLPVVCFDNGGAPILAGENFLRIDTTCPEDSIRENLQLIERGRFTAAPTNAWNIAGAVERIHRIYEASK
ncbi:glycosyltransferase family 4 protein [Rhodococcus pyridinivorans]